MKEFDRIKEEMKNHFSEKAVEERQESVKWSSSSSTFIEIFRNGRIKTGMPLHQLEIDDWTDIEFLDEGVKIKGEGFEYLYRK